MAEDTTTPPNTTRETPVDPSQFPSTLPTYEEAVNYPTRKANGFRTTGTWAARIKQDLDNKAIKVLPQSLPGAVFFNGPALLDEEGYIARPVYELDTESANTELMNLTADERLLFAQQLKRVGYYGSADVSESIIRKSGFNETDMAAMLRFMRDSNVNQKTIRAMLPELMKYSAVSSGTTVKVTPKEDIAYYMKQASLSNLGRMPTKAEVDQAIKYIQNAERAASGRGTTAPSTSVLAQAQAQQAAPGERAAYSVGQAINLAFRALAG